MLSGALARCPGEDLHLKKNVSVTAMGLLDY